MASAAVEHAFRRVWEEHSCFQTSDVVEVFLESAVREAAIRGRSELAMRRHYAVTNLPRVARTERPIDDAWSRVRELIAPG
jgi:hypothetical protein